MSDLHTALRVDLEEDLLPLSALLHQRGVGHRVFEESGRQVLQVEHAAQAPQVQALYKAWRAGELRIELSREGRKPETTASAAKWRASPVTLALVALSVCGFLVVYLPVLRPLLAWLTFTPFEIHGDLIQFEEIGNQYWRLITPVFLHFGWLHIVFNSLWLWELGRSVERVMGGFNTFMLFIVIALVSNASQYLFGGPGLFGGMSGVVYGLLGFAWVAPMLQRNWLIQPSPAIMLFMVGWLVACLAGLVETLGFGKVANAAHLGGLLSGALLGAIFGLRSRLGGDKA